MSMALEGGITYWCGQAKVKGKYLGDYGSEQISRGGTLYLYDNEDDSEYELTPEKFTITAFCFHNLPRNIFNCFSCQFVATIIIFVVRVTFNFDILDFMNRHQLD